MDGVYGYLFNDCCYIFKVYGFYLFIEDLMLGVNFILLLGCLLNVFGIGYLNGVFLYGDIFYVCVDNCIDDIVENEYIKFNCGSYGCMDWMFCFDLNVIYNLSLYEIEVVLRVDVFNVFNVVFV